MHKGGFGFGIELLIQFSPPPIPSAIGKMMPQGGFGDFELTGCLSDAIKKAR
jgi:hypothetical protein